MEHIRKLEINRLIKELDFIKSDFNYKSELVQEVDPEFIKSVDSFLDKHPQLKQVFNDKILSRKLPKFDIKDTDITESSTDFQDETKEKIESSIVEEVKDPKLKLLYRSIAKSTHPDKLRDESLKELYLEATSAYENNNILPIFTICDKLGIPYDVTEEETNLIKSEIESLKGRSELLESTYSYKWFISNSNSEKEKILFSYIKSNINN